MSVQTNTNETNFGRIGPDDALTAIRAENRRAGVTMSGFDEIATAYQLADALRLDSTTGRTFVVDVDGNEKAGLSTADFVAQLQAVATLASRESTSEAPTLDRLNATERAVAMNKASRSPRSEAKAADAVGLVGRYGNPWKTGNLTHRAFVTNNNPTLANTLKLEAGVRA